MAESLVDYHSSVLNNHMMNTREPCHDMGDFTSPHLCLVLGAVSLLDIGPSISSLK